MIDPWDWFECYEDGFYFWTNGTEEKPSEYMGPYETLEEAVSAFEAMIS